MTGSSATGMAAGVTGVSGPAPKSSSRCAAYLDVAKCDLKLANPAASSSKRKSSANRCRFRRTCSLSRRVVTP